jgi:hypothetical protein
MENEGMLDEALNLFEGPSFFDEQFGLGNDHYENDFSSLILFDENSQQIRQLLDEGAEPQIYSMDDVTDAIMHLPALPTREYSSDFPKPGHTHIMHDSHNLRPILPKRTADLLAQDLPSKKKSVTSPLICFIISKANRQNPRRQKRGQ